MARQLPYVSSQAAWVPVVARPAELPTYATAPFIDPDVHSHGWHDAWCRVTWTPKPDGQAVSSTRPYLDGHGPDGAITLECGMEEAAADLGLTEHLAEVDAEQAARLCAAVNVQLTRAPHAEVECPTGRLTIELVPVPGH